MTKYIQLLRPLQWLKNTFVFAPIFFSNNLLQGEYFWPTLIVFAAFCLISSSIYCFNDLKDIEADRLHPKKCKRPIASGAVSVTAGYAMMALCMVGRWQDYFVICRTWLSTITVAVLRNHSWRIISSSSASQAGWYPSLSSFICKG